jgi:hypothetical protein
MAQIKWHMSRLSVSADPQIAYTLFAEPLVLAINWSRSLNIKIHRSLGPASHNLVPTPPQEGQHRPAWDSPAHLIARCPTFLSPLWATYAALSQATTMVMDPRLGMRLEATHLGMPAAHRATTRHRLEGGLIRLTESVMSWLHTASCRHRTLPRSLMCMYSSNEQLHAQPKH